MKCFLKKKFSRKGAWTALHRITSLKLPGQFACKMYECPCCKSWHLSKHPPATNLVVEWKKMSAEGIV